MRVIGLDLLAGFARGHTKAKSRLEAWTAEVRAAEWRTPQEVKDRYAHASFLHGNRVVFNIKGNDYRLVVRIHYATQVVRIERIGTHTDYERWVL